MDRFTDSLRGSVYDGNLYAALTLALTLPDICGKLEWPESHSQRRYSEWFDAWLGHLYKRPVGPKRIEHTFMSGTDVYALRCSYLHQGDSEIFGKSQKARDALDSFVFVQPPENCVNHCNQDGRRLELQVNIFCEQMADAVDEWYSARRNDPRISDGVARLLTIYSAGMDF